jgi:anti-sigma regulatory factor (Ser/Thr protein kinase)
MTGHECTFELENDLTLIPPLISYFQRTVKGTELLDDTDCLRVGVALEEALMNAVYHGNLEVKSQLREQNHRAYYDLAKQRMQEQPYSDRRIVVTAIITRMDATYIIRDAGPGFDPDELPDPTDPANLDRPFGRGLLLMHTFMDEVKYNDKGNEVTLVKRASDSGRETEPAAD